MNFRIFLVLILHIYSLSAQEYLNIKNINIDEGLPSDLVYQITEDLDGYIWMGTDNGIAKYNGSDFIIFQTKEGLPSNDVFGIKTDSQNRKWLTGFFNGAYFIEDDKVNFLKNTEKIINPNFVFEKNDSLFFNILHHNIWYSFTNRNNFKKYLKPLDFEVRHVKKRSKEHKFILNYKNDTIAKLRINGSSITVYKEKKIDYKLTKKLSSISIDFSEVIQILEDSNGNLWIIDGDNRLLLLRNYKKNYIQLSAKKIFGDNHVFFKQAVLSGNNIYFLTNKNILYSYNLHSNKLKLIKNLKKQIRLKLIKKNNQLFIIADDIFFKYDINYNKLINKTPKVNSFDFQDIDFTKRGVFYTDGSRIFNYNSGAKILLRPGKRFKSINIHKNGILVNNEFSLFNLDFNLNLISKKTLGKNISTISEFRNYIIVGTYSEGLFFLDNKLNITQKIPYQENIKYILPNENKIYVGTDNEVSIFSLKNDAFVIEKKMDNLNGLGKSRLNNLDENNLNYLLHCSKEFITILEKNDLEKETNGKIEILSIFNTDSIYDNKTKIILPRDKNNLSIKVSLQTFDNPKNFDVFYTLGNKKENSKLIKLNSSILNLGELSPGNYFLTLYAKPLNKESNASNVKLNFTVGYYFWETKAFVISIISFIIIIIYSIMNRIFTRFKQRTKLMNKIKELEAKSLSLQMSPHFIFNILNNIQSVMILEGEKIANKYITSFSKLLRITLEITNSASVSLNSEIKYLELYLDLEKKRLQNNLKVIFNININNKKLNSIELPSMLFQPIIENAIIHGLNKKKGDKKITINFSLDNNCLIGEVIDNGIGREVTLHTHKKREIRHKSYSTKIIEERINLFNSYHKKLDFSFNIIDLYNENNIACGTKVRFNIPLFYNYNL